MKKRLLSFIIFLLIFVFVIIGLYFSQDIILPRENQKNNQSSLKLRLDLGEKLEKGDGIVTNIWIEEERIDNLINHKIKYLFVDIGDTRQDGYIQTPKSEIKEFLDLIDEKEKENNYSFILLPYSEINTYNYNVNSKFEENFIRDYKNFIELGFDGIFVDIEPVKIGEENKYINFLEKLNSEIPGKIISVYSGAISEVNERDNEWEWNLELYKKVYNKVNLIFIPGYDFGFNSKKEYQNYINNQVKLLSSKNFAFKIMLGVPTHKPEPETIENALEAYNSKINNKNDSFVGYGIFAEWTSDETEWEIFEDYDI